MDPLHLGLVAIGGRGWMGGANYVRNLAAAVENAAPGTRITWLCGESIAAEWQDVSPRQVVPLPQWSRLDCWLGREKTSLRRITKKCGINFLYPLTYDNTFNLGVNFPLRRATGDAAWAGWIPDFQHRSLPHLFTPEELCWRDSQMQRLAEDAPRVVLSSQHAMSEFQHFYPQHAAKAELLTFRVNPILPANDPTLVGDVPERFFLVCNQFWKHKNHAVIFEALELLRTRGIKPQVLCTGELSDYRNDDYIARLHSLLEGGAVREQVTLLGLIPRDRQVALLRRAVAIIQPSLFEGWSTVVEDVRALGRPCLLSDLPVHREQDPPRARFFAPESAAALADLMAEAWQQWPAGPNAAAEAEALQTGQAQQAEFGRTFLSIAESIRSQQGG